MRVLRFLIVACAMLSVCSVASAQAFFEDFESYEPGSEMHGQGGWTGWDNTASVSSPASDAFAYSGSNSVEIIGSADLTYSPNLTGGKWVMTAMQYIPSGTTGTTYFILLNQYPADKDWSVDWTFNLGSGAVGSQEDGAASATIVYDQWVELRLVIDLDNNEMEGYYNGELYSDSQWSGGNGTFQVINLYGNGASSIYYDDITLVSFFAPPRDPSPADRDNDAARDGVLSWAPGQFATSYNVYLSTSKAEVEAGDPAALLSEGQAGTSFDPGLLEFGQTYYWRVEAVSPAPESTVYSSSVWTFTAEPFVYPIENIIATSNSIPDAGAVPENAVNGSGINADDQHSREASDMWLGAPDGADPVHIQFEFDRVYKLYEMLVWNYNGEFETILAFGIKDVTVEYSENGEDWVSLGDVTLAQGTASVDYTANTTIDLQGVPAKFVRMTVNSGYGMFGSFGLSEVRILHKPVQARKPQPADEATGVALDGVLGWSMGREAASNEVYLSTEEATVADGTALVATTDESSYPLSGLDVEYGATYYWKVNEVNEAEEISTWEGAVWSFTAAEFGVVDDFESYDDEDNRIYSSWIDGYGIDGNGSTVGNLESPFAEQTIVNNGGQSMPLFYDNTGTTISEAEYTFGAQDWTANGIKTLSLAFQGAAGNSGQLYVKINGAKVAYDGDAGDIASVSWLAWNVDLSAVGGNLSSVTSLVIGIEGAGASGVVYIDDVRLYPKAPEFFTPADPGDANLAGHWDFDEGAGSVAADASGNGNNGAIVDGAWQAGQIGSALKFNGTSSQVNIPAAAWDSIDQQATAAVWMYVDSSVTQSPVTFAAYRDPGNGNTRVMNTHVVWDNSNVYLDTGGDGTAYDRINKAAGATDYADAWIHWAFTKNAETGEQKIYRNGILWHSGTGLTKPMTGVTTFTLGAHNGANFWNGAMDDFRLYNTELSQEEILWLAGKTAPVHKPL